MRAVQVSAKGGQLEIVEREVPTPRANEVLIRVKACGICHGDAAVKAGAYPGIAYPRIPGHEVIGLIERLGSGVAGWQPGERVGVGWHGGHCFVCGPCRRGRFAACETNLITGITVDGGYAEYMVARQEALVRIPESLDSVEGAPLLCAGRTTFGDLKESGARSGDLVGVLGLGGLGHLAVQFAAKMGFRTVAISQGKEKEQLARSLGAHAFIDSTTGDAARASGGDGRRPSHPLYGAKRQGDQFDLGRFGGGRAGHRRFSRRRSDSHPSARPPGRRPVGPGLGGRCHRRGNKLQHSLRSSRGC